MKKLALALVCLFSLAFFASCDPETVVENPEPSITVLTGDEYLADGDVMEIGEIYAFGFRMASNPETLKPLAKLVVTVDDELWCDTVLTGTEFEYVGAVQIVPDKGEVYEFEIKAVVTDAAGETNSATIKVGVNVEVPLVAKSFTWRRDGGADGEGLEEFGLRWTINTTTNAIITPLEDAALYRFEPEVWDNTNTELEKAVLFSELPDPIESFTDISVTAQEKDYDIVLGTVYNDNNYLIHVTHSTANQRSWHFVITGEVK